MIGAKEGWLFDNRKPVIDGNVDNAKNKGGETKGRAVVFTVKI
jgi:hypothetical protein